jgi:membrane associated rhomboid family serine protease
VLSEDVQENPGTLALTASWIVIFALMVMTQWRTGFPVPPWWMPEPFTISTLTSHRFGDMTWLEVHQGQPWRLLTATFIHFGLIHLVLNGLGLFSLGRIVEPWYRTGPFLAICMVIGGLGNLLGGAIRQSVAVARPWLASHAASHHWPGLIERFLRGQPGAGVPVSIHTGGGSTILLGLITLAAVVGWKSRTRIGSHLYKYMVVFLILTAGMGIALPNLVDNYGHLGGAILGLIIGLFDPLFFRLSDRTSFRVICSVFAAIVVGTCLVATVSHDRSETRYRRQLNEIVAREQLSKASRQELDRLYVLFVRLVDRSPYFQEAIHSLDAKAARELLVLGPALPMPPKVTPEQLVQDRVELEEVLGRLESVRKNVANPELEADIASLVDLGRSALRESPGYKQFYEFLVAWRPAHKVILTELARSSAQRIELEQESSRPR